VNSYSLVECSAYAGGGAIKDTSNIVVCGKDTFNLISSSTNVRKEYGTITCDGGCDSGSINNCMDGEL